MKTILVPTDFSENALSAFKIAKRIAWATQARIHLLHISPTYRGPMYPADNDTSTTEKGDEEIRSWFADYYSPDAKKVSLSHHVTSGLVIPAICDEAENIDADMIVMGTKGAANIIDKLIGSTTLGILEESKRSLLIVPNLVENDEIKQIGYAAALTNKDEKVIKSILSFSKFLYAKLHCIHANKGLSEEGQKVYNKLANKFRHEKNTGRISFSLIPNSSVFSTLNDYIKKHSIDLMVMLSSDKKFIKELFVGSMSKKIALNSEIPTLIYHKSGL